LSSIVGPNVVQAIIDKTGNVWHGFAFLFATCLARSLVIWLTVDVPKGRRDAERWASEAWYVYDIRSSSDGTRKDDDLSEGMLSASAL